VLRECRVPTSEPTPARRAVLEAIASRVPVHERDGVRVAIDGVDGAGKTVFADDLADVLRSGSRDVVRVSADDFHNPRLLRYRRGRSSPEGFWRDSYDYIALRTHVMDPFGPGGSLRYQVASHDLGTDEPLSPEVRAAPPGAVLVVDGLFLHRDELARMWDLSVFLRVDFEVSVRRLASRDGTHPDFEHQSLARYVEGQRMYFSACHPWQRADVVVDATDLDAPTIIL
jgi:uridine kinase